GFELGRLAQVDLHNVVANTGPLRATAGPGEKRVMNPVSDALPPDTRYPGQPGSGPARMRKAGWIVDPSRFRKNAKNGANSTEGAVRCPRRAGLLASEPKHLGHAVQARFAPLQPVRGAQRAGGEGITAERGMSEAQLLAGGDQPHVVLADDLAAAQAVHADPPRDALAGLSLAAAVHQLREFTPACPRQHLAERERRAGRRVHLVAMVSLDDLGVVILAQA